MARPGAGLSNGSRLRRGTHPLHKFFFNLQSLVDDWQVRSCVARGYEQVGGSERKARGR